MTTEDYPYKARDMSCNFDESKVAVRINKVNHIQDDDYRPGDEELVKQYLAVAPVTFAMDASTLKSYRSGIFTGRCGTRMNHAVLGVGYGVEEGEAFWKVKNSWGNGWGESGYFRMQRGTDKCGLGRSAFQGVFGSEEFAAME